MPSVRTVRTCFKIYRAGVVGCSMGAFEIQNKERKRKEEEKNE